MQTRWFNFLVLLSLVLGLLPVTAAQAASETAPLAQPAAQAGADIEVEPALRNQLAANETTGYLIYFKEKPDLSPAYQMDWIQRGRFVANALNQAARRSQANVRAYLDAQGIAYKAFWIQNVISVESSNRATVNRLMTFTEIEALRQHRQLSLVEPEKMTMAPSAPLAIEPNILHVLADQVWALGYTGEGLVVANVDTGVRYSHDALVNQYRGNLGGSFDHNYNWWDPYGDHPTTPGDDNGHGTHTMGTTVGDDGGANQIGMAPDAQWIACRACNTNQCAGTALLECAQFIAAPWDLNKANANPDKRPNVVNNSWGDCGRSYDPWYQAVVDAWHAAGIYPVFSNGNASNCGYPQPPGLNTVGNPARYGNVTGVGSTGRDNGQYAPHSNWGPTDNPDTVNPHPGWEDLKPQVLAPGVNIRSSVNTGDSAYQGGWGGTSMSAPHVTGLIALMWQAAPCLVGDYAATETIIENTAIPIPYDDGTGGGAHVPNYAAGWGEINALAAVQAAAGVCGDSVITGEVLDEATNATIAGAAIMATNAAGAVQRKTTSNAQGVYVFTVFSDTYTLQASRYGYQTTVIPGVEATAGATTTQHIAMTPAAFYEVSGQVTDAATGWPLYAQISITGDPVSPVAPDNSVWTDPVTGQYSVMLSEGVTYTFKVAAWVSGYNAATGVVGPLTTDATADFALQADMAACMAPGYSMITGMGVQSFEEAFPPAGWSIYDLDGGDPIWEPEADGHTGATSALHAYGPMGVDQDGWLVSPAIQLNDAPVLSFFEKIGWPSYYGKHSLWLCTANCGSPPANFTQVKEFNTPLATDWTEQTMNLSAYANQSVVLAFRYEGDWAADWYVDDVRVSGECALPPAGGLVVGNVYDENYPTVALNGATVVNAAGHETVALPTPLDAAVDDAFYTLFAPTGVQTFTATATGGYGADVVDVTVVDGDTVAQDFFLPAGLLNAAPEGVDVTVELGYTAHRTLNLENSGGMAAEFSLVERAGQTYPISIPAFTGELPQKDRKVLSVGPAPQTAAGDKMPEATDAFPLATNPPAFAIDVYPGKNLVYIPDTSVPGTWNVVGGVTLGGAFAGDFLGGDFSQMYVLDYATNRLYSVDMATGAATAIGNSAPVGGQSWTGMTGSVDGTLYASSAACGSTSTLYTVDPATGALTQIGPITNAPCIIDIAINADDDLYGVDIVNDTLVRIDPATGAGVVVGSLGFSANYAQGLDFEEESGILYWAAYGASGELRVIDTTTGASARIGAFPGGAEVDCLAFPTGGAADVPWLDETPTAGAVPAAGTLPVSVDFDAAYVDQPGEYHAELIVKNDTPYGKFSVPVTMTVVAPASWGNLAGTVTGLGVCDGDPAPLEEAEVFVQSATTGQTWLATTGADGRYNLWMDQAHSPLTITVTAPDYFGQTGGVMVAQGQATVVDFNLRLLKLCLSYDPAAFDVTLPMGDNTVELLTLSNTGAGSAAFELVEMNGGFVPLAPARMVTIGDPLGNHAFTVNPPPASAPVAAWPAPEAVEGLETLTHSVSQNIMAGNSVACNNGFAHTDNSYVRTFYLPDFGITSGFSVVEVDMGIEMADGGSGAQPVEVRLYTLSGALLWENMTLIGQAAVQISDQDLTHFVIPVTGFAPAGSTLVVEFFTPDGNAGGNILFVGSNNLGQTAPSYLAAADCGVTQPTDTATIGFPGMHIVMNVTGATGDGGGDAIPWLTETPVSGTLAADTDAVVDLTFDAGVPETMQPGTYYGQLKVASDAANAVPNVPVTLTVEAPATWGKLTGEVAGLGYCDVATPTLLAGAEVTIESGAGPVAWILSTDAEGVYQFWLDAAHSPVDITIAYPDHVTQVFENVVVTADETTVVDAELRWATPCLTVNPDMFNVSVELGMSTTVPFSLTNWGAFTATFDLAESNGGVILLLPQLSAPAVAATGGTSASLLQFGESKVALEGSIISPNFLPEDILLDQAPNQANGIFADASCDLCGTGVQVVAENFALSTQETIGQIVFWTGYYPGDTPINPDSIRVIFHADASGIPGATLSTEANVPYERVQTGVVLFGVHEWMHTLTLANPVTLGPGTYWVEIYNNTGYGTDDFFWEVGNADTVGNGLPGSAWATQAPGGSWNLDTATQMAIQLIRHTSAVGGDIPWLFEDPESGAVDADDTFIVDLTLDAGVPEVTQPGEYFGALFVNSDDPVNNKIAVPVTMTVTPPATWGKLMGTVQSLGYCDADPAPVAGLDVHVEHSNGMTWTLTTDVSGTYQIWLESGTLTVTVEAPAHSKGEATGVVVNAGETTTQDFDLRWLAPCVGATPAGVHATLELGATASEVMTLTNTGAVDTDWDLVEENLGPDLTGPLPGYIYYLNEDFEGAFPPAGWTRVENIGSCDWESSATTGYPNQTGGSGLFANANSDWCGDAMDVELWTPAFDLSAAAAPVLSFQSDFNDFGGADDGYVDISVDGGATWTNLLHYDGVDVRGPRLVQIDLSAYVGQSNVVVRFHYVAPDWDWYWQVDEVSIAEIDLVTWLAEAPTSGALVADTGEQVVDVDFDASVVDQPGEYYANLWVNSDDPFAPTRVPVTMTVTPPASWGELLGVVSSLGRCDAELNPLEDAEVVIWDDGGNAVVTLLTDATGAYSYWLPTGDYTVTVTAADHVGDLAAVTVPASDAVTQDFSLIWLGPCVSIETVEYHLTLAMGMSGTLPLTLTNTGLGAADFAFAEANVGFVPSGLLLTTLTAPVYPLASGEDIAELVGMEPPAAAEPTPSALGLVSVPYAPAAVLYDNGPLVNSPGTGPGGADESVLQSASLGMNTIGFGHQVSAGNRVADDFTVTGGAWYVDTVTFFAYQTGSSLVSTISAVNLQIWDGVPGAPGSTVIFGDTTTNRLINTTWAGIYRVTETTLGNTMRPVMANTIQVGISLPPGTYWLDWQSDGTLASGPWASPVTINGQTTTGNAIQYTGAWNPALDTGTNTQQDFPFVIEGRQGGVPWLFEDPEVGTVSASSQIVADITMDAAYVWLPGEYYATLSVDTNDDGLEEVSYPVTMTVTLPATYGQITGVVKGLGPCDDPLTAAPLSGAEVTVESATQTWTLSTDAAGSYAMWLNEAHSPVTITVAAQDYVGEGVTDVVVISSTTTTQNLTLRPEAPCFAGVTPTDAHVTLALGMTATLPISVVNTGAGALDWKVQEADGGFQIMAPNAGEDVLVVAYDTTAATAMETALTNLGYSYLRVDMNTFQAMTVDALLEYQAVLYTGSYSGDSWAKAMAYLDAGGAFLIADNDLGWSNSGAAFYQTYLQSTYVSDAGSDGPLTGLDIMAGINPNISADPYPDDFTVGAAGTCIFDAPSPNCAGVKVERLDYKAIYLAWDFQYSDGMQTAILGAAMPWLGAADAPWLTEDPTSGTVAPEATAPVILTFDAGVPEVTQPGDYYATLTFKGADAEYVVPVTMTVESPAAWGKLEGLVQGLGYCDVMTAPLEGAVVFVESAAPQIILVEEPLLEEGFENAYPPTGWALAQTGAPDDPGWVRTTARVHSGAYSVYHNDDNTTGTSISWLIMPQVTLPAAGGALYFWQNQAWPTYYEYHGLWVSTTSSDPADFVELTEFGVGTSGVWEQRSVDLTAYAGQSIYLAFRYEGDYADEWYIDDVAVTTLVEQAIPVNWTLTTDAAGEYGLWLDELYSPLTVTISNEAGYAEQVFTGVEIVSGTVTTVDANLIWQQPCIVADPDALALAVSMGTSTTVPLNLANMGAVTGTFLLDEWSLGFDPLGPLATGGPDAFGYRFADSNDFGISPVYDFVDISGIGAPLALGDNTFTEVAIGFAFKFYGNSAVDPNVYNSVFVNSNGFLSFGAGSTDISPDPVLPDPTLPNNLIAAAWYNLVPGTVYVQSFAQCPYNPYPNTVDACFIAQYTDFTHKNGSPAGTWEVILFRSGSILMQYADVSAPDATTGIEGPLGLVGLNYGPTLADELAICFAYPGEWTDCQSTQVPWLDVDVDEGDIAVDDDVTIAVTLDATAPEVAAPGDYMAWLLLQSNDPLNGFQLIPVTMTVEMPATMARLSGNVYGWGYCDAVSQTLAGAQVVIQTAHGDNHVLTTGPDGAYVVWVEAGQVTMTVAHDGYVSAMAVDTVAPGVAPQRDMHLYLDVPCVSITYDETFEVVVKQGEQLTRTLQLHNNGAGALTYNNVLATGLWVNIAPKLGGVAPRSSQLVNVVFDATGLAVGVYNSNMEIVHNDPQAGRLFVRPIQMTVVADGAILLPMLDAQEGNPGETVTYVMTVTNLAGTTVTFNVLAANNAWTTIVPATVTVAASGTATFTVDVDIPVDAHTGDSDTVNITVESQGADGQVGAAVLQTTVAQQPVVLALTKTANPTDYALPGNKITYTITLANNGNDPLTIALTDLIPVGTTYVINSVTGGATLQDPPGGIVWDGVLDKGAQHTVTFQVTVNAGLVAGTPITNTVTVTANGESYTAQAVVLAGRPTQYIYLPLVLRNAQ